MDKAPIITWKDIFGFKRSYTKIINGRTYKGPSVKLRGLTSDKISQHHSFIIILIFRIFGLRNLEEDKEIEAVCEIENGKSNDKANLVDFECIANETIKDNMELNDIKSDDQKIGTLKLDNLKATDSSYNPIIFRTKETDITKKTIEFSKTKYNFILFGNIDGKKKLNNANNIPVETNLGEKGNAYCDFSNDNNGNAKLNFNINIKESIKSADISFTNNDIQVGDNKLYVENLDNIHLTYNKKEQEHSENHSFYRRKSSSSNKEAIFAISIVGGVIVLAGIIGAAIYLVRIKKSKLNVKKSIIFSSGTNMENIYNSSINRNIK